MDHKDGEVTSVDAAVSPDDMDIMFQQAQRNRRGGQLLDDVPPIEIPSTHFKASSASDEEGEILDLPDSSDKANGEDSKGPVGPIQFIKRKSIIQTEKRTPLERFRLIANQVKNNLKWAHMFDENKQEEQRSFIVEDQDGKEQRLTFDVNAFKANVQTVTNALPPAAKIILRKNPWERKPDDLAYITPLVTELKCFEKYSVPIKQELAYVLYFENFETGRIIVKQGHPGLSFYFILSGSVTAEVTEVDKHTGEQHTQYIGEFHAGSSFGELALLHGTKRTATIICKEDSDFLRLDKTDFDMVLRRGYQLEWETRMNSLRSLAAFGDWSEEELRATNDRAKVVEFQPNTVILGDISQPPDNIYFIKSGKCKVVRDVTLVQSQLPFGRIKYSLPPINTEHEVNDTFKLDKHQKLVERYLHVATIKRGDFFGVGEDLQKTCIISIGRVECIRVSQVAFLRHERGTCLEPMRKTITNLIPSYETAFESYLESKRWRSYKRGLVKELAHRRHIPNSTKMSDVPLISRKENKL